MNWYTKNFEALSLDEFHDILKLRIDIFVVEQNCPYSELDNKDKMALHCFAKDQEQHIIAYTRIFKPGDYYKEASFGRVLVQKEYRNKKLGYELIKQTLLAIQANMGQVPVKIGAQAHLERFYGVFDFKKVGQGYIEDGIPHIYMLKKIWP